MSCVKIYQIGGSVRDMIRGVPCNDIDYVVVGATPQWMLDNGYKQVGADFPVFLDDHGTEFALARTERKVGSGYHGFETDYDSNVTLEDDAARRDLTINAVIYNPETKEFIDPFNGIEDIKQKRLKHVSVAFREDPVRVLRLARFKAQFGKDWTVDLSTIELCKEMVENGELRSLTKERIWKEMEKALNTTNFNDFLNVLHDCNAMDDLFYPFEQFEYKFEKDFFADLTFDSLDRFFILMLWKCINENAINFFCERFKIPNEYKDYAIFQHRVWAFCNAKELLAVFSNKFDYEYTIEKYIELLDFIYKKPQWIIDRVGKFINKDQLVIIENYRNLTKNISFDSLSIEQQTTLKGKEIKKAIDDVKIKTILSQAVKTI